MKKKGAAIRILVVDNEDGSCRACRDALEAGGFEVETRKSGPDGLKLMKDRPFDLVLCALDMPRMGGIEVLRAIRENHPGVPVIVLAREATVESAVEALKGGAADYMAQPFAPGQLAQAVESALDRRELPAGGGVDDAAGNVRYSSPGIIGESEKMQEVFRMVARVAGSPTTVLLRGESGSGKELIARAIHVSSLRRRGSFVAVDSGAIPETLIESELFGHERGAYTGAETAKAGAFRTADGGTLFLDEVGNMSGAAQMKLLRAIEQKQVKPLGSDTLEDVDVRLIAATNRDLEARVKEGSFREDLFWRLSVFVITVPPLRERKEDIALLAMHFLRRFAAEVGRNVRRFSAEAMSRMVSYDWPGNVRELENTVLRAIHMTEGAIIEAADLPARVTGCAQGDDFPVPRTSKELNRARKEAREKSVAKVERLFVLEALERSGWNVTRASDDVGMARQNFQALMRKHGIKGAGEKN
ncbi:MAG: sigma-54 dependent transcriptional regulator [Pseudomonadota bacterium]